MHKYEEGSIMIFTHENKEYRCLIEKKWHLKYKGVYPTYKIILSDNENEIPDNLNKKMLVSEHQLSY